MKGFKIDASGTPLSTVEWEPVTIITGKEGDIIEVENPKPENAVFPDNFDEIFKAMTAPAAERKNPVFSKDGSAEMVLLTPADEITKAAQNEAFTKLIGAFTIEGSYPQKQKAMTDAITSLPETATSDELYDEAVKQLG